MTTRFEQSFRELLDDYVDVLRVLLVTFEAIDLESVDAALGRQIPAYCGHARAALSNTEEALASLKGRRIDPQAYLDVANRIVADYGDALRDLVKAIDAADRAQLESRLRGNLPAIKADALTMLSTLETRRRTFGRLAER